MQPSTGRPSTHERCRETPVRRPGRQRPDAAVLQLVEPVGSAGLARTLRMGLFGPLAPVFDQELYVAGEDDLVVPAGDLYARTQATTRPKLLIFIIVPDYI